jgi:hypothetical protein
MAPILRSRPTGEPQHHHPFVQIGFAQEEMYDVAASKSPRLIF